MEKPITVWYKNHLLIAIFFVILASSAAEAGRGHRGLGLIKSWPAPGIAYSKDLSGRMDGVLSTSFTELEYQANYSLSDTGTRRFFGFGSIGLGGGVHGGMGVGVDFNWQRLDRSLPEVWLNSDLGLYTTGGVRFGFGIMYRF